jgi:hypothetical protein
MILLVKLLLAHLLGDFLFQPNSWIQAKEKRKLASWQLYSHAIIHFVLVILLVSRISFIKCAVLIAITHLLIDILKLYLLKETNRRWVFFADQIVHLLVITGIWFIYTKDANPFQILSFDQILIFVTAIFALTTPSSLAVKTFISKWTPQTASEDEDSLQEAGKTIGMLERFFVFAFVLSGHWEAIGFLLAAKSIFRFGDLKESKDRKLTEYVLIGTLISFGIAIMAGVLCKRYLNL